MIWLSNIKDLQYYNQPKGVPCYCEHLVYSSDMYLQGNFNPVNGTYGIKLYVFSADGLTQYEDATNYFDVYFAANNTTGRHYFNARLKQFSPAMCAHECFIIKAVVTAATTYYITTVFSKYTERYCQTECCDVASGITFDQNSLVAGTATGTIDIPAEAGVTACGEPLIRIISKHDCYNIFADEYFGAPDVVISGNANFHHTKITSCKGRLLRKPREISRTLTFNCKLQKVESTPTYLLECFDFFPPWKMYEIEGQFHAKEIYIDDYKTYRQYQLPEGEVFKQVNKCVELYKLETVLQGCPQRQIHGCGEPCSGSGGYSGFQQFLAVPANYSGGFFFADSKEKVAADVAGLMDYFRTYDGMVSVEEIDMTGVTNGFHAVIGMTGSGYLPSSIYYDNTSVTKRIYSFHADTIEEIADRALEDNCATPTQGDVTVFATTCITPETGEVIITPITAETIMITSHGDWVIDEPDTTASVYNSQVSLSISVQNTTIIPTGVPEDDELFLNQEVIGIIAGAGRPTVPVVLDSSNNNLSNEQVISIDEYGVIRYSGEPTLYEEGVGINIQFSNLVYNI